MAVLDVLNLGKISASRQVVGLAGNGNAVNLTLGCPLFELIELSCKLQQGVWAEGVWAVVILAIVQS